MFFYKGYFPDTAGPVKEKKFCLVNIDVDIFESVKACMEFFYPRMSRGGVIICHDYSRFPGVLEAVDTFFQDKPEAVFELGGTQCLIIKL